MINEEKKQRTDTKILKYWKHLYFDSKAKIFYIFGATIIIFKIIEIYKKIFSMIESECKHLFYSLYIYSYLSLNIYYTVEKVDLDR